jgi:hypothetical protein
MSLSRSAPLLLLGGVVGGWVVLRVAFLASTTVPPEAMLPPVIAAAPAAIEPGLAPFDVSAMAVLPKLPVAVPQRIATNGTAEAVPMADRAALPSSRPSLILGAKLEMPDDPVVSGNQLLLARMLLPGRGSSAAALTQRWPGFAPQLDSFPPAARPAAQRWTGAAWLLARPGSGTPTLGNATLGGSQAGARISWQPLRSPVALFGRVVSSGRLGTGVEAAAGLSLRPSRRVPVDLVVERRVAVAQPARDAFAAYAVGGGQQELAPGSWRIDGYGAAGVVGARRRDVFAEGSLRVDRPIAEIGRVTVRAGGGAWAATQPGATRLDIGPALSAERRGEAASPRLMLDWRQRVAGNAAPDSGPALTLAVDF